MLRESLSSHRYPKFESPRRLVSRAMLKSRRVAFESFRESRVRDCPRPSLALRIIGWRLIMGWRVSRTSRAYRFRRFRLHIPSADRNRSCVVRAIFPPRDTIDAWSSSGTYTPFHNYAALIIFLVKSSSPRDICAATSHSVLYSSRFEDQFRARRSLECFLWFVSYLHTIIMSHRQSILWFQHRDLLPCVWRESIRVFGFYLLSHWGCDCSEVTMAVRHQVRACMIVKWF